jgi:predicted PurR-regulated permease PerM
VIYLFLLYGALFGFLGSLMAFVITYHEYQKHKFTGKRLLREAFHSAVVTFIVFVALMAIFGYLFSHYGLK